MGLMSGELPQEAWAQPVATVKMLVPSSPTAPPLESVISVDHVGIPPTASSIPSACLLVLGIGFNVLLLLTVPVSLFVEGPPPPPPKLSEAPSSPDRSAWRDDLSWWPLSSG